MSKVKCCINLTGADHSRSELAGKVILNLNSPTRILGFGLLLEGRATATLIFKTSTTVKCRRSVYHFLLRGFNFRQLTTPNDVEQRNAVVTNGLVECTLPHNNGESFKWDSCRLKLKPGSYEFPFRISHRDYDLIPAEFKSQWGSISYSLSVYLTTELKSHPKRVSQIKVDLWPQILLCPTQLMTNPVFVESQASNTTGDKFVTGKLTLARNVFLVGQTIPFELHLENHGSRPLLSIAVNFMQKCAYFAAGYTKSEFTAISEKEDRDEILRESMRNSYSWDSELPVPENTMPSFESKEKCLQVLYFVKFTILVAGSIEVHGEIPVTIGTGIQNVSLPRVRTHGIHSMTNPCVQEEPHSLASLPEYADVVASSNSNETLPPTYEDAIKAEKRRNCKREWDKQVPSAT